MKWELQKRCFYNWKQANNRNFYLATPVRSAGNLGLNHTCWASKILFNYQRWSRSSSLPISPPVVLVLWKHLRHSFDRDNSIFEANIYLCTWLWIKKNLNYKRVQWWLIQIIYFQYFFGCISCRVLVGFIFYKTIHFTFSFVRNNPDGLGVIK